MTKREKGEPGPGLGAAFVHGPELLATTELPARRDPATNDGKDEYVKEETSSAEDAKQELTDGTTCVETIAADHVARDVCYCLVILCHFAAVYDLFDLSVTSPFFVLAVVLCCSSFVSILNDLISYL